MNVAYAWLAGQADAADRVAVPVYLAADAKKDAVEADMRRRALDEWLAAPAVDPVKRARLGELLGVAS